MTAGVTTTFFLDAGPLFTPGFSPVALPPILLRLFGELVVFLEEDDDDPEDDEPEVPPLVVVVLVVVVVVADNLIHSELLTCVFVTVSLIPCELGLTVNSAFLTSDVVVVVVEAAVVILAPSRVAAADDLGALAASFKDADDVGMVATDTSEPIGINSPPVCCNCMLSLSMTDDSEAFFDLANSLLAR